MSQPYNSVPDTSVKPVAVPDPIEEVVNAMEHFRKKMRGDMRGEELAACARLFRAIDAVSRPVRPAACEHDWKIWPETNGQSQRCMKCGAYRDTPDTSQHRPQEE